jgi:hypothetical protein
MICTYFEKVRKFLNATFKICSKCAEKWRNRSDFLADRNLTLTGYMANFEHLELGMFLFDHKHCGTTLTVEASKFTDLYNGPVYQNNLFGTEECQEFCLDKNELGPCPAKCECAYVREVVNIVRNWERN